MSLSRGYNDRGLDITKKEKYLKNLIATRNQLAKELGQLPDTPSTTKQNNSTIRLPKLKSGSPLDALYDAKPGSPGKIEKGGLSGSIAFPGLTTNNNKKKKGMIKLPIFRLPTAELFNALSKPANSALMAPATVYKHHFIPCADLKNLRRSLLLMFQKLEPTEQEFIQSYIHLEDYELEEVLKNLKAHLSNDSSKIEDIINDLLNVHAYQTLFQYACERAYDGSSGNVGMRSASVDANRSTSTSNKNHTQIDALRVVSQGMDFKTIGLNDQFKDYLLNNNNHNNNNNNNNNNSNTIQQGLNRSNSFSTFPPPGTATTTASASSTLRGGISRGGVNSSYGNRNDTGMVLPALTTKPSPSPYMSMTMPYNNNHHKQEIRVASTRDKLKTSAGKRLHQAMTNSNSNGNGNGNGNGETEDSKVLTQALLSSILSVQKHNNLMKKSLENAQFLINTQINNTNTNTNTNTITTAGEGNHAKEVIFMLAAERLQSSLYTIFIYYELQKGMIAWKQYIIQSHLHMKMKKTIKFLSLRNVIVSLQDKFIRMLYRGMNQWKIYTQQEIIRLKKQRILSATILIQAIIRRKVAYKRVKQIRYRLRFERLYTATIKLQTIFRGKRIRWKYIRLLQDMKETAAAVKIQTNYRGYTARKRVKLMKLRKNKHKAATYIQCMIRKQQARRKVKKLRLHRLQYRAAVQIQRIIRGFLARRYVALMITTRVKVRYVVKIQAMIRGMLIRMNKERKVKELLDYKALRESSATKIQSVYRGYRSRIIYRIMLLQYYKEREEQTHAVIAIQRIARGYLARQLRKELVEERYDLWIEQAKQWTELWSEDEQNWFYYNVNTGQSVWEPTKEGYVKNDGMLVLASGEVIEDPDKPQPSANAAVEEGSEKSFIPSYLTNPTTSNTNNKHKKSHHAAKSSSKLCSECNERYAIRKCEQCGDIFCTKCYKSTHALGQRRHHTYTMIGPKDCNECELLLAIRCCITCDECFCDSCWRRLHSHGKRVFHPYSEINKDGKIDKRIYTMDGDQLTDGYDGTYMQQRSDGDHLSNLSVVLAEQPTIGGHGAAAGAGGYDEYSSDYYANEEGGQYDHYQLTNGGYDDGSNGYALQPYQADTAATTAAVEGDGTWTTYYDDQNIPYYYNNYTGESQYDYPYAY